MVVKDNHDHNDDRQRNTNVKPVFSYSGFSKHGDLVESALVSFHKKLIASQYDENIKTKQKQSILINR